ncbi:MAG: tetratricopeptide repeat protein [Anaerovibrio sp.]|nr:tetratricopeptide repeat protein [Anaerovibrio sp.]
MLNLHMELSALVLCGVFAIIINVLAVIIAPLLDEFRLFVLWFMGIVVAVIITIYNYYFARKVNIMGLGKKLVSGFSGFRFKSVENQQSLDDVCHNADSQHSEPETHMGFLHKFGDFHFADITKFISIESSIIYVCYDKYIVNRKTVHPVEAIIHACRRRPSLKEISIRPGDILGKLKDFYLNNFAQFFSWDFLAKRAEGSEITSDIDKDSEEGQSGSGYVMMLTDDNDPILRSDADIREQKSEIYENQSFSGSLETVDGLQGDSIGAAVDTPPTDSGTIKIAEEVAVSTYDMAAQPDDEFNCDRIVDNQDGSAWQNKASEAMLLLNNMDTLDDILAYADELKLSNQWDLVLMAYKHALEKYGDDDFAVMLVIEIGNIYKDNGRYPEAIKSFEQAMTLGAVSTKPHILAEFKDSIRYIRAVYDVLQAHNQAEMPFYDIPGEYMPAIEATYHDSKIDSQM